jgi:hypothetical protein
VRVSVRNCVLACLVQARIILARLIFRNLLAMQTPRDHQVDGSMNMLRVWGGGMYQDDVFYDECDRLGVMLYHDMMFSERLYPHNQAFVDNVFTEVTEQVNRLRHHPSIVLWDANNEDDNDPAFFYDVVLTAVANADDSRPLWPASPSSGFATGVDTATGRPNGNPLTGRFQEDLDTHQPYNFCSAQCVKYPSGLL